MNSDYLVGAARDVLESPFELVTINCLLVHSSNDSVCGFGVVEWRAGSLAPWDEALERARPPFDRNPLPPADHPVEDEDDEEEED